MSTRRPSRRRLAAALGWAAALLLAPACTAPQERRERIEEIDEIWVSEVPDDSLEEMREEIRALRKIKPDSTEALISVPLLAKQVLSSPSALVRAESLRAAWELAASIPSEPLSASPEPAPEFNGWMARFEELDGSPLDRDGAEIQALTLRIGGYRFPPSQARYAVELATVTVVRAYQRQESPVQEAFASVAPGAVRHALVLATLQAADDSVDYVREEALLAARHLHPDTAFRRLAASLASETDPVLLFALLDSVAALGRTEGAEAVAPLLEYASRSSDAAVRRRAQRISEELEA